MGLCQGYPSHPRSSSPIFLHIVIPSCCTSCATTGFVACPSRSFTANDHEVVQQWIKMESRTSHLGLYIYQTVKTCAVLAKSLTLHQQIEYTHP